MRYILPLIILLLSQATQAKHIILCGGPALRSWENLRVERDQHDLWWANFIRSSTLRIDEIQRVYGIESKVRWIVYRPGYKIRSQEDGKPYIDWITKQATKRGVLIKWVDTAQSALIYLNSLPKRSIHTFDFFGHSNKYCFMLDYGNQIMGASKHWIHEDDLVKIQKKIFTPTAICQSYGCHTGESMSERWHNHFHTKLIGAIGKTDYTILKDGLMPQTTGTWSR